MAKVVLPVKYTGNKWRKVAEVGDKKNTVILLESPTHKVTLIVTRKEKDGNDKQG